MNDQAKQVLAKYEQLRKLRISQQKAAIMKALQANPEFRAASVARMKSKREDPAFMERLRKGKVRQRVACLERRIAKLQADLETARRDADEG